METPTPNSIYLALAKAQGEFPSFPKNKTVNTGSFQYNYADLTSIIETIKPIMAKYELSYTQSIETVPGVGLEIHTTIFHSSGASIIFKYPLVGIPKDMKSMGGISTYGRRYGLCLALGISADDDLDGNENEVAVIEDRKPNNPLKLPQDPGEYVVSFGKKYKGKKLKEIDPVEIFDFVAYIKKDGPPKGIGKEFTEMAEKYLAGVFNDDGLRV